MRPVVFDIGRVLIEWDVYALYRKLFDSDAAIGSFINETALFEWNLKFDQGLPFQEGLATLADEFPHYRDALMAFDHRWQETIPGIIHGSVELLQKLASQNVPLYAITNFSAEKWPLATARYPFLETTFKDVVVSGLVGLLKPEPAIFNLLAERNGLDLEECVFIDDSEKNVEGARRVGMDAILFVSPKRLEKDLKTRGYNV